MFNKKNLEILQRLEEINLSLKPAPTAELMQQSIWPDIALTCLGGLICGLTAAFTMFVLMCCHKPFI